MLLVERLRPGHRVGRAVTVVLRAVSVAALALIVASGSATTQQPMDLDALVQRGDLYLHPDTFEPYDGEVVAYWDRGTTNLQGMVRERGTLSDGQWDGVHEWYHLSGELATRETYRNGRLDGPSETYFKTGQLSAIEHYANDRLHGSYESYWHRGRLAERGQWANGEPCGNWLSFGRTIIYPPCPTQ